MADFASPNASPDQFNVPDIGIPLLPIPKIDPNDAISALHDVVKARTDQYSASADAVQKNTVLQQDFERSQEGLYNDTIDAYDKLNKINQYGGVNPVTKFLGLFDSDFNFNYQKTRINENDVKAQQGAMRTKTLIEINNQLPALKESQANIAAEGLKLQQQGLELVTKFAEIDQKSIDQRISVARLNIDLGEEKRKQVDFALKSMPLAEAKKQLGLANQGKGDWSGLQGFLEDRINTEVKGDLELSKLRVELANGNLDLIDKQQHKFASVIPVAAAGQLLQDAMTKNQSMVTFGTGKDAVQIPTNILAEEFNKSQAVDKAVQATVLGARADTLNNDAQQLGATISAISTQDPRATRELAFLKGAIQQFDPQNPAAYPQLRATIDAVKGRMDEVTKSVASTYGTPEAKAAVQRFADSGGQFDVPGATAVVSDTMGKFGTAARSRYSDAFDVINTALAGKIAEQNVSGAPFLDKKNTSQSQTQAMLTWAMSQKADRIKIPEMKQMILADPTVKKGVHDAIVAERKQSILNGAIADLSKGPTVAGPFAELAKNPSLMLNANGEFSPLNLQSFLETQSMNDKYAVDYNQVFIDAVRKRTAQASTSLTDPTYTMDDRALETAIFGQNPNRAVSTDIIKALRDNAVGLRKQKQQQIEQDRRGIPQQKAADEANSQVDPGAYLSPRAAQQMQDAAAQAAANAPSATGSGKPADFYKQLYGK